MQALGRDRRGAEASSHTRGLPIFKKRAVRKSTRSLPLSRFLLLLVRTLRRLCGAGGVAVIHVEKVPCRAV